MNQLGCTNNSAKFELLNFNRDVEKTRRLEESMKKHGYIPAYPIHCVSNGAGKFKIKAGHHRFYVARKLGIPFYYVVCEDKASIFELERSTNRWVVKDYLTAHMREGKNKDYVKVSEYMDETGIGLQNTMSMLGGHSAGSGNFQSEFKDGTFKIRKDSDHAEIVKDIVLHAKKCGIAFFSNTLFVQAISKVVWVDSFCISKFKAKIKLFSGMMEKKANLQQHLDQLEDIYNRQSRDKVPLAFLAAQKARDRNIANSKK
ncbi:MAG: ParB N-terminal domain-containing protein [Dehalococcoidia bacterium]|jgi:hypothetical protein